jgi:hypothetical protein
MFNQEGEDEWQVEFYRDTSQALTSQGDAQRIFATVINAVQKFVKKHKPQLVRFSATKEVEPGQNSQSRAKLYNRIVNRYANDWGYDAYQEDHGDQVTYELTRLNNNLAENFADGKKPGRKGLAKRSGVNTKASVSSLRKTAKNSSGEKQRMAHWLANMKAGRAKKKTKEAIAPHGSLENEFELMKAGVKPAALVNPHTFVELYKPIADQLGWPYQQIKIASNSYNTYAVGQPGEEKRVQRLVKLVQDMNANLATGIKPNKEYHIEMGKLLGYSDQDIQDFLINVDLAERTKQK